MIRPFRGREPSTLDGWDVRARDVDGIVMCAYNPQTQELRVNPKYCTNTDRLIERIDSDAPSALVAALTLGLVGTLPTDFNVIVKDGDSNEEVVHYSGVLSKIGYLRSFERELQAPQRRAS